MTQGLVKEMKIGLSNQDKQNMDDEIYDKVSAENQQDRQEINQDVNDFKTKVNNQLNAQSTTIAGLVQLRPSGVLPSSKKITYKITRYESGNDREFSY